MIWGVDLGTRKLAFFALDALHTGSYVANVPVSNRGLELTDLQKQMCRILEIDPEPVIFIEEPPKVRNMRTFLHLAQTCGMVLSYPARTYCVPVASWKKATVGKGNASKEEVASWFREEYPAHYDLCAGDQDRVDAACICLYGQEVVDLGERGFGFNGSG